MNVKQHEEEEKEAGIEALHTCFKNKRPTTKTKTFFFLFLILNV